MSASFNSRPATPDDVPACVVLRGQTRENAVSVERLAAIGITTASWAADVASGVLTGYVCTEHEAIVGYCFADQTSGEVVVLALLPAFEGRGIGRHLLGLVVRDLMDAGHRRLFLGCAADPSTRSHGFYRHLGWASTGVFDRAGDEILELFPFKRHGGDPMKSKGPGFAVLYRWRLHAGAEAAFERAWARVSELLLTERGSLGSRLHRGSDGIWYSYAQWPSSEARDRAFALGPVDSDARRQMAEAIAETYPEVILTSVCDFMVSPQA